MSPGRAALAACLGLVGCNNAADPPDQPVAASTPAAVSGPIFTERAQTLGLDFVHFNGMVGEYHFCEIMGGGGGLLDYDGDGDLDAYLVQGSVIDPTAAYTGAVTPPPAATQPPRDRLFRNDLIETGTLGFTDVTDAAGLASTGYGMGVAVGDYDDNGTPDLYVTNLGPNALLRNNGDGTFTDVTGTSGTGDERWSAAATFVDYDADGRLDLFVGNYVDFTPATNKPCYAPSGARDYCSPLSYQPHPDRLYRNRGDGTFEDVSASSGIALEYGGALGVVARDFNGDGRLDLYVANDALANQLWINQGEGRFRDEALIGGCAYNRDGGAEGSMGVDAGDFDADGDEDLFMVHTAEETNTLFVNDGRGLFEDGTVRAGLGAPSRTFTGFGTSWIDYDNDGFLDLLVANGAVVAIEEQARVGDPYPLHQANQLFHNEGTGRFEDASPRAGDAFAQSEVSRAAAFGDLDNDGDTDVLIVNNNGPARVLMNEVGHHRAWIGLRLERDDGHPQPGGRIVCTLPDGRTLQRHARVDGSYCAAHDPRVLLGLGDADAVSAVQVTWPDGRQERWDGETLTLNEYATLRQGTGQPVD